MSNFKAKLQNIISTITKQLIQNYQDSIATKPKTGYTYGRLSEDATSAELADGTTVSLITKGLPGRYAPIFNLGNGQGLADYAEPVFYSVDSSNRPLRFLVANGAQLYLVNDQGEGAIAATYDTLGIYGCFMDRGKSIVGINYPDSNNTPSYAYRNTDGEIVISERRLIQNTYINATLVSGDEGLLFNYQSTNGNTISLEDLAVEYITSTITVPYSDPGTSSSGSTGCSRTITNTGTYDTSSTSYTYNSNFSSSASYALEPFLLTIRQASLILAVGTATMALRVALTNNQVVAKSRYRLTYTNNQGNNLVQTGGSGSFSYTETSNSTYQSSQPCSCDCTCSSTSTSTCTTNYSNGVVNSEAVSSSFSSGCDIFCVPFSGGSSGSTSGSFDCVPISPYRPGDCSSSSSGSIGGGNGGSTSERGFGDRIATDLFSASSYVESPTRVESVYSAYLSTITGQLMEICRTAVTSESPTAKTIIFTEGQPGTQVTNLTTGTTPSYALSGFDIFLTASGYTAKYGSSTVIGVSSLVFDAEAVVDLFQISELIDLSDVLDQYGNIRYTAVGRAVQHSADEFILMQYYYNNSGSNTIKVSRAERNQGVWAVVRSRVVAATGLLSEYTAIKDWDV